MIADTKMPELEHRFPSMRGRVVFVSGDVPDQEKQEFLVSTDATVLVKPFDVNDVRAAIRRRLAEIDHATREASCRPS